MAVTEVFPRLGLRGECCWSSAIKTRSTFDASATMAAVTGVKSVLGGEATGLIDAFEVVGLIKDKLRTSGQPRDPKLLVFLDYDGTLSPIVDNPTDAVLPSQNKATLELLSKKFPTIIVTGRSHEKVQNFVKMMISCIVGATVFA